MSTPVKIIIMLLAWLIYALVAYKGCIEPCCPGVAIVDDDDGTVENPPDTLDVDGRYAIDFAWNNAQPNQNEGYAAWRQNIIAGMADGKVLRITGLYYESEAKPEGFENLGFARAERVKRLLLPDIPEDRMVTRARALEGGEAEQDGYFQALDLAWIDNPTATAPVESEVVELDDRIVIRFPYDDAQKELDPTVDEYLEQLATRLQSGEGRVRLTGHTDNTGTTEYNQALGMRRAQFVQQILIDAGVNRNRIIVESKGETQPVDTNDTEAGRSNNRRVEVRLTE